MDFARIEDAQLLILLAGLSSARPSNPDLNGAIGELYNRYGRLVFTIAVHIIGDVETAEEITQDVFVRACDGAHTYRPEMARVSSWLVSITRHRSIDELRRRGARSEKNQVGLPEDNNLDDLKEFFTTDGPEVAVEGTQEQSSMRQMIAALPHDQRQVLGLAYFKGLSHNEIASLLGEPLGTVKSRIRLAMQKLRDIMNERGMLEK